MTMVLEDYEVLGAGVGCHGTLGSIETVDVVVSHVREL